MTKPVGILLKFANNEELETMSAYKLVSTVFCENQNQINAAIQAWVNVKGYEMVSRTNATYETAHYITTNEGYTINSCTPSGKFKTVIVFGKE
jgi:hypothetical protein